MSSPPRQERLRTPAASGDGRLDGREQRDAHKRARVHPLTLRFYEPLETEFTDYYHARTLTQVRVALMLGTFLYTAFGILDVWIAPEHRHTLWMIRYAGIGPLLLVCLGLTFTPGFDRYREVAVGTTVFLASLGIVAMTAVIPPPGSYLYYAGLLLAIVYAFTLVRLTLISASLISLLTMVSYFVVAVTLTETPGRIVANNIFFLTATFIIGFSSLFSMERYARSNFLQRRVIARRTRELEEANEELRAKHRALLESRATTVRTARRSDLMYAALADALPGTVIDDKYRVQEKIGSGSVGTVFRGEHILLHHPVAIKVFRPAVGQAAMESVHRFRLEGISACRINHPGAVMVLDFDVTAGSLAYLVMELLEGRSLSDELRAQGRLPPARSLRIATAICDVLAAAHAAGIVHRDIKPGNVFLHRGRSAGEPLVKVIDFGIAKLTDQSVDPQLLSITASGMFLGTPAYIAPERMLGEPYDGRADVYAVGVLMYEMLAGRLPYGGRGVPVAAGHEASGQRESPGGSSYTRESMGPPRLSEMVPGISPALEHLVSRAMAVETEERPTAAELGRALRDCEPTV